MNLCEQLVRQAEERPDAVAIIEPHRSGDRSITFRSLDERTARGAGLLLDKGLERGDRVLILQPISIELYVALIAVLRVGLVVTLIDPSAGTGHLAASLERAAPRAFLGSVRANLLRLVTPPLRRLRPAFSTGLAWPGVVSWRSLHSRSPHPEIVPCESDDDALITFTSGSTGAPKAAVRSHGFLLAQHAALARAIELRSGEVDLATLPVFVLANLASGVTSLLPDADMKRPGAIDPEPVLRQIARHRPTRTGGSPAFYEQLLGSGRSGGGTSPLASFEKIFTGGAPVFPRLLRRLQQAAPGGRIVAVYGSTEAEPIAHVEWTEITEADHERMRGGGGLLTGTPVPEIDLRIVRFPSVSATEPEAGPAPGTEPGPGMGAGAGTGNGAGTGTGTGSQVPRMTGAQFDAHTLAPNEPGEIVVRGDHVIASYLDGMGDEETKFEVDGGRWHRTGDTGYLDTQRRLWLLGRTSAVIEDEAGALHPFAVECAASRFEWVGRTALLAEGGRRILVVEFAGSASGSGRSPEQGLETLVSELGWARLDRVRHVERIPVDRRHNAKVDYVALRKILESD